MRVLILGAGGYLGGVLFAHCNTQTEYSVYGTYLTKPREGLFCMDVLDEVNMQKIVDFIQPDIVVWCILDTERELELSNIGLRHLLSFLKPNVRVIYVSTGLSSQENQNEDTSPEPREEGMYLANYVNGKILGEQLVRTHINHVIIRPGQIYGFGASGEPDKRMLRLQNAINNEGKMSCSASVFISTVHVDDLASCIVELLNNDFVGTLCVAADKAINYFDFYTYLASQIGIHSEKVIPDYEGNLSTGYFDTSKVHALLSTKIRCVE